MKPPASSASPRRRYVVAMVLGTALSTFVATPASDGCEATTRAVTDISRYCTACWRNAHLHPDCWTDCTQEVFSRLIERLTPDAWQRVLKDDGEERREFLRAIDTVKKRTRRARKWSGVAVESVADPHDAHERRLADDREVVWRASAEVLTPRQQRILRLSLDGWPVHDIARDMDLPAERVSDEKYKAIQKLRQRVGPPAGRTEADQRRGVSS